MEIDLKHEFDIEKLQIERARQGKSIVELSRLTGLNIKTIIRIEKNKVVPRSQTVGKIAKALGKDVEDFILKKSALNN